MAEKVDQDVGELATVIRVNLYRHAPNMPSYPEDIVPQVVKPYLEKAFAGGRREGVEEAAKSLRAVIARGYDAPKSKRARCEHGRYGWEDCIPCYDDALEAAITALMDGEGK